VKHFTQPILFLLLLTAIVSAVQRQTPGAPKYRGWGAYGGGPEQMRYSTLTQINRSNVAQLQPAWTYDSGESGGLQTQPIVADGVLYAYTPMQKAFALRADTGEHLWTFDPHTEGRGPNRGLMYWASGSDRRVAPQRVVAVVRAGEHASDDQRRHRTAQRHPPRQPGPRARAEHQ